MDEQRQVDQLEPICAVTGYSLEDLAEVMDDKDVRRWRGQGDPCWRRDMMMMMMMTYANLNCLN